MKEKIGMTGSATNRRTRGNTPETEYVWNEEAQAYTPIAIEKSEVSHNTRFNAKFGILLVALTVVTPPVAHIASEYATVKALSINPLNDKDGNISFDQLISDLGSSIIEVKEKLL